MVKYYKEKSFVWGLREGGGGPTCIKLMNQHVAYMLYIPTHLITHQWMFYTFYVLKEMMFC